MFTKLYEISALDSPSFLVTSGVRGGPGSLFHMSLSPYYGDSSSPESGSDSEESRKIIVYFGLPLRFGTGSLALAGDLWSSTRFYKGSLSGLLIRSPYKCTL